MPVNRSLGHRSVVHILAYEINLLPRFVSRTLTRRTKIRSSPRSKERMQFRIPWDRSTFPFRTIECIHRLTRSLRSGSRWRLSYARTLATDRNLQEENFYDRKEKTKRINKNKKKKRKHLLKVSTKRASSALPSMTKGSLS